MVAVRNDDLFKWEIKQLSKSWQRSLFMPWRRPDPKFPAPLGECVSKDDHSLLGEPERSLKPASSIIKGDKPTRKYTIRIDYLKSCLGHVVGPEESRTERLHMVATDKLVNISNVISDDDGSNRWRPIIKTLPQLLRTGFRDERVKHQPLAPRFDISRRHNRLPVVPRLPVMMLRTPNPQASGHIAKLDLTGHRLHNIFSMIVSSS